MTIELMLRDVVESDLPIFYEQQLDPEATAMAAFPSRDREPFMAHWSKILANGSGIQKTILFNDRVAGNIMCWEQDGKREVGYWLGKEYWGKGIATQALKEFFHQMKIRPVVAHVAKHNIASRRVLEKCGFTLIQEDKYYNPAGEEVEEFVLQLD